MNALASEILKQLEAGSIGKEMAEREKVETAPSEHHKSVSRSRTGDDVMSGSLQTPTHQESDVGIEFNQQQTQGLWHWSDPWPSVPDVYSRVLPLRPGKHLP
jgi:hypothetical protein